MDAMQQTSAELMDQIARLTEENLNLRDALRASNKEFRIPTSWKLTACEETILRTMLVRDVAAKQTVYHALYGDRIDGGPDPKIIDVWVCKMRPKLKPYGLVIETVWGRGHRLVDRQSWAKALKIDTSIH